MNVSTGISGNIINKQPRKQGRQQHAYGRKRDAGKQNRPDFPIAGIHSPRKKNQTKRYHTDKLGIGRTIELNSQPVAAKKHTDS